MNRPPPRSRLAAALGIAALAGGFSCGRDDSAPPIVLLVIDTLRADYLGAYGFEGAVSPGLDRIAAESFVFRRCYAQAPWTKPSMASLFCSLYPGGHGVLDHEGRMGGTDEAAHGVLGEKATTLAELLRDAGYQTAAVVANPWITRDYGFAQGFDHFADVAARPDDPTVETVKAPARVVLAGANAWLDDRDPARPFFLYLHLMDVHGPYDAPDSCYTRIAGSPSIQGPERITLDEFKRIPFYLRAPRWTLDPSASNLPVWRARYAAGVRNLDEQLGSFLDALRAGGVLDDAWLIVTSDHGEELFEHGGWDHGATLYGHQLHVPLLIRPPGGLPRTKPIEEIVRLIDLMPTLVGLAGGAVSSTVDGADLRPVLAGRNYETAGVTFATGVKGAPEWFSLQVGAYKLILDRATNRYLLFDLDADPAEKGENLGVTRPHLATALLEHMGEFLNAQEGRAVFEHRDVTLTPEQRERLRSLGYMN